MRHLPLPFRVMEECLDNVTGRKGAVCGDKVEQSRWAENGSHPAEFAVGLLEHKTKMRKATDSQGDSVRPKSVLKPILGRALMG